jgi:predicted AlkP superfamily pyrophosphatase or phosphodiesterase
MLPSYPSSTFPNHYTLATGLYPENHGIVDNRFYDRSHGAFDNKKGHARESRWFHGKPLWTLAEEKGMLSYSSYWFGSEAPVNGIFPSYLVKYSRDEDALENRINAVVAELKKPVDTRPHFLAFYMSDVDQAGHKHGPNDDKTKAAIKKVNVAIKKLTDEVAKLNLPVNYIFVSDHGMVAANTDATIPYPQVDSKKFVMTTDETMIQLYAINKDATTREADVQATYDALVRAKGFSIRYDVVRKGANRMYSTGGQDRHGRIGDILLIAKSPYQFFNPSNDDKGNPKKPKAGCHGYDPKDQGMHATFFAWGPAFNKTNTPAFKNVDVYPLVAHLLGLKYDHVIDGDKNTLVNSRVLKDAPLN